MLALSPCVSAQDNKSLASTMKEIDKKNVVGQVFDEDNEPLPGATVMLKGTDQGVATDIDGQFTILVSGKNPIIEITYIGMKPVTLPIVNGSKFLRVKMQRAENMMSEIVVTGYQNIKRESATGAYQILSAEEMDKRYTGDIASNLEGRIPGLVRYEKTAGSVSNPEDAIVIRGMGTFEAKSTPLVVVDGLPIEGGMNTVNPYDVENITVLKDAAAASIYGARAANGVIVITTKQAKKEKLTVDFNADLSITEKQKYDNYSWLDAAGMIELERYNFNGLLNDSDPTYLQSVENIYNSGLMTSISPVCRLLLQNYRGELSDSELNATLSRLSRNDYRKEYQNVHDRTGIMQQYNLALRIQGKSLSSNIVLNYSDDNMGVKKESLKSLTFKYRGDLKAASWLDLSFGVNVLNNRRKDHNFADYYGSINSFLPYQSMYDENGNRAGLEADVYLNEDAFSNQDYELKDNSYNLINEMERNIRKYRYTNTRTYIHSLFKLLPGWTAQAQFQYEDITSRSQTYYESDSYYMRYLYNLYTTASSTMTWVDDPSKDWWGEDLDFDAWMADPDHYGMMQVPVIETKHHIPDGAVQITNNSNSQFYTFRAQTRYANTLFEKHDIDVLAGLEYRQTHTTSDNSLLYGYDNQTLTNNNLLTDWEFLNRPTGMSVLGSNYTIYGAPTSFGVTDVLHRYYSVYATGNYVYDRRYSVSGSYRVDKCDLFGTDPKFRGRPLWSVGGSWNAHNESFMQPYTWIDALKLRVSYGLTGNIDSSVSSYLTASFSKNPYNGANYGKLNTPPNDQLRWEKTSTWNAGIDFAFLGYRLNGSFDFYRKSGSDLLTRTDLDVTTGWTSLTINSGNMINTGVELQLTGRILEAKSRNDVGINLGFNIAHNHNKVTHVSHLPASGSENLSTSTLHRGYPMHSIFSYRDGGLVKDGDFYYASWIDNDGERHTTTTSSGEFTVDQCVYSGSLDPTISGAVTPEITWRGFSLSAMINFYGGHYMRTGGDIIRTYGSTGGYPTVFGMGEVHSSALEYWKNPESGIPGNGYRATYYNNISMMTNADSNVVHADYMKFRSLVLSYNFEPKLCHKIGLNDIRLRVQMNNIATWARNGRGLDPEAVNPYTGTNTNLTPKSYTMSLYLNL